MKRSGLWLIAVLLWSCGAVENPPLRVAVSANAYFALDSIARVFSVHEGIKIDLIAGSSGKLCAQLEQGAPYDIFVSADVVYPERLLDQQSLPQPPRVYAYGRLLLWSQDTLHPLPALNGPAPNWQRVGVANPRMAPYGAAALAALDSLGWRTALEGQIVYGESIGQVNQFVTTGAVEVGFSAASVLHTPGLASRGQWVLVPDSLHPPLAQAAILSTPDPSPMASQFFDYLYGQSARAVWEYYGYDLPE